MKFGLPKTTSFDGLNARYFFGLAWFVMPMGVAGIAMNIVQNAERFWRELVSKKMVAIMARQFLHFDLLGANDLFGKIFHAIIGQFITFTTDVFLPRKQWRFYTPRGMVIILHSLRV